MIGVSDDYWNIITYMNSSNYLWEWLIASLFWLGVIVVIIGIVFTLAPQWASATGNKLNHWISTKPFFDALDNPRYQERWIYRHHRLSGVIIISAVCYVLFTFVFVTGIESAVVRLVGLAGSDFTRWLYEQLFYIFLGASVLALIFGCIMLIRPSLLKNLEAKSNRWIGTSEKLDILDSRIGTDRFVGNPRLFGLFVILGGLYMMASTGILLL
ncbi:MAG: hypothetical protein A3I13_01805 [Gammaproteobacteria bacterium RIFCSPLOWO2_02_FULL_47_50]|nr:MAG: hypothetical protein A3I13_01805 [Gammaproteobacteria bacterium RIFCSPLOWO2_02_FULL_47_50]